MLNVAIVLGFLSAVTFLLGQLSAAIRAAPIPSSSPSDLHWRSTDVPLRCGKTVVPCRTTDDCRTCLESGMTCVKGKCVSPHAAASCQLKHGGLHVLTRNLLGDLTFDCVCMYPHYYTGPSCDDQNVHVCQGGVLRMDVTQALPTLDSCTCPPLKVAELKRSHLAFPYPVCVPAVSA